MKILLVGRVGAERSICAVVRERLLAEGHQVELVDPWDMLAEPGPGYGGQDLTMSFIDEGDAAALAVETTFDRVSGDVLGYRVVDHSPPPDAKPASSPRAGARAKEGWHQLQSKRGRRRDFDVRGRKYFAP